MDLTFLENTSISLRELDEMNPTRKLRYYFFMLEKNKAEKKRSEDQIKYKGREVDTFRGSNLE